MSDETSELHDLALAIEEALSIVKRLNSKVDNHKAFTDKVGKDLLRLLDGANDRLAELHHTRLINERLLWSVISELAKAKIVDAQSVAKRFSTEIAKLGSTLPPHSIAQAKQIGDELSHPGFPDAVPTSHGHKPVLIVDNDPPET